MLPVTAAPTPTGGVVPPRHCRPYWATSVSWNMNTMLMAVGMGSGEGYSGCPFSGPVQIFNMSDPARPRLLHTLNVSKDWVRTVAFNHDGTWLAVGGDDNKVRLYDPVNPSTPLATLSDATGWIMSIDFNRDDTRLAVGSSDDQVRIYDMLNLPGVTYNISNATRAKRSVAYNHYGTLLAVGGEDEKVRIYRIGIRASATTSSSARPSTIKLATASTTISKFPSGNSTLIRHSSSYTTQPITSATAQPTTPGITNVRPLLIHVINIDPNVLPVTTAPTPTGGFVPPRHCGPHRVMSVSWNINSMLMAVGIASGRADPGCPHSGSVQ
ncbi:WD40 repeat domain-containing protein, partial [Endozoicomonas sp. ONNA1]